MRSSVPGAFGANIAALTPIELETARSGPATASSLSTLLGGCRFLHQGRHPVVSAGGFQTFVEVLLCTLAAVDASSLLPDVLQHWHRPQDVMQPLAAFVKSFS